MKLALSIAHSDRPASLEMTDEIRLVRNIIVRPEPPPARDQHAVSVSVRRQDDASILSSANGI